MNTTFMPRPCARSSINTCIKPKESETQQIRQKNLTRSNDSGDGFNECSEMPHAISHGTKFDRMRSRPSLGFIKSSDNEFDISESENSAFKSAFKQNLFIQSYYPTVVRDSSGSSEDCDKFKKNFNHEKKSDSDQEIINESNSVGYSPVEKRTCSNKKEERFYSSTKCPTPCQHTKTISRKSTKSDLTFDSNTYTLHSYTSEHSYSLKIKISPNISWYRRKCKKLRKSHFFKASNSDNWKTWKENEPRERSWDERSTKPTEEESENDFFFNDFARMHDRIKTLEYILHKTLERKVKRKRHKHKIKRGRWGIKYKFNPSVYSSTLFTSSATWSIEGDSADEETSLELENYDTESELRNIKKRLKILEKKLKEEKETPLILNCKESLTTDREREDKSSGKKASEEQVHCREQVQSSKRYYKNTKNFEAQKDLKRKKEQKPMKVKNEFILNCKKLKKKRSGLMMSTGTINTIRKNHADNILKESKKITSEHSALSKKLIDTTFRYFSFPDRPNTDEGKNHKSSEAVFVKRNDSKSRSEFDLELKSSGKRKKRKKRFSNNLCKKNSQTNILLYEGKVIDGPMYKINNKLIENKKSKKLKKNEKPEELSGVSLDKIPICYCTNHGTESHPWYRNEFLHENCLKRKVFSRKGLKKEDSCSEGKNMAFARLCSGTTEHFFKSNPCDSKNYWVLLSSRHPSWRQCIRCCDHGVSPDLKFIKNSKFASDGVKEKSQNLKLCKSHQNPLLVLKRGEKIEIPVLFEEVCKERKENEILQESSSNMPMKFVLVEGGDNTPSNPLKKLFNKLSQTYSSNRSKQYIFGVSKWPCVKQQPTVKSLRACYIVNTCYLKSKCSQMREMYAWTLTENCNKLHPPLVVSHGSKNMKAFKKMNQELQQSGNRYEDPDFSFFKWMATTMSYSNWTILAISALVAAYYWRRRNFYRLAALIDGPPPLPIIGNAMEYLSLDHIKILDYLLEITTKYNGLAKVWLGEILLVHISKPEDMEILLSSNKLIEKNRMYRFFDDVLGQGLLNARGDIWRKHRKIIAPTFHPSILKHFVKIFGEQSKILVKVLEKNADGQIFNVFPYIRNCALDFITETALENHIGAQLRVIAPATRAAERLMNITYNRMFKLWLYSDFIFYKTQQGKEYLRLRDLVKESTEPLLEVKKKEMAQKDLNLNNVETVKRKSFFRQLVELNENSENFNDKELRDEVVTMIITGYETTAATVGFILVMLGIHQDVQAKVYEEVKAMQELLKGRELEAEDLNNFEYMDRVIKETLRLYPVGPIIFRECTTDLKLSTCTIPKGASVAVVILKTHRDPSIWENPEKFDPDNFLPEKCEKRHPYAYIPFSAGPRNCIGKKYAYLSMRVMLYHILSNYKIFCDLKDEDIQVKSEVTLKMVGGFKIRMLPRHENLVN